MKIYLKITIAIITLGLTGCCSQELVDTYSLSEYEKSLIPFISYQDLAYINHKGQKTKATTQPRTIAVKRDEAGPESCKYWESETLNNFINFIDNGFSIQLNIESNYGLSSFKIKYVIPNSDSSQTEYFPTLSKPSKEEATNISLQGFEFKNVFVFNNPDENGEVEIILYSSEGKGVVFIGFSNGAYLKLE